MISPDNLFSTLPTRWLSGKRDGVGLDFLDVNQELGLAGSWFAPRPQLSSNVTGGFTESASDGIRARETRKQGWFCARGKDIVIKLCLNSLWPLPGGGTFEQ